MRFLKKLFDRYRTESVTGIPTDPLLETIENTGIHIAPACFKGSIHKGHIQIVSGNFEGHNDTGYKLYLLLNQGLIMSFKPGIAAEIIPGIDKVCAIAAEANHMISLTTDGTVWETRRSSIQRFLYKTEGLANIIAISLQNQVCFALRKDGTIWQKRNDRAFVMQVPGITRAIAIAGQMALLDNGRVVCWGDGKCGRLGNGTITSSETPVYVTGLTEVMAISNWGRGALALRKDGSVWAWGDNAKGHLGIETPAHQQMMYSAVPVCIKGLTEVVAIDSSSSCLALLKDGTVKAWGCGLQGALGFKADECNATPMFVPGLNNILAIKAGAGTGFALRSDGTLLGWGAYMKAGISQHESYWPIKIAEIS